MGWLLLCASLLCLATRTRSETDHVLTTPAQLFSRNTGKICLNIVRISEPLDVSVVLEHNGKNTSIIAENVVPHTYFQCVDFQVPSVREAVPVAITFSAIGSNTQLRDRKTVVINTASDNCMIQMDKPLYKPGNKVLFRLICLNSQLKPVDTKFSSVYMQDPSRARIFQWLLPESKHGVASLEFQLIRDATPGSYMITAEKESGYPLRQWFSVEPYVLPRFQMSVDAPQTMSVTTESANFKVSASYSYGEPVAGKVTVRHCRQQQYYGRRQNCFRDKGDSCATMTGELGPDGTYSGIIDMSSSIMRSASGASHTLDVTVTESGTGVQATESHYMWVTSQPANLRFEYDSLSEYYKRGLEYIVVAKLTDENDRPMPNQEIDVQIDNGEIKTAITNSEGRIEYAIDTSDMVQENFTITVSYTNPDQCFFSERSEKDYPTAEYTVYRFYSQSGSFLHLRRPKEELSCEQSHSINVEYIISPEGAGDEGKSVTFYYLVMSKSVIVQNGQKDVDLSNVRNGSFSFDLLVSPDMAPRADLVVYSILEKEMITDTVNLNIEKCFKNQVSMTFSEEKGAPGSKVDVQLSAAPNSHCALRVIDSSLLILNPYEQFSADRVFNSFRFYVSGYHVAGFDVEDPAPPCEDPDKLIFYNGRYYLPASSTSEGDAYNLLKSVGLVVGTSSRLRRPVVCDKNPPPSPITPMANKLADGFVGASPKFANLAESRGGSSQAGPIESNRRNFSDTFLWVMVPIDTEGRATLSEAVPDTITTWQGTAFCTSEEAGFGMTRHAANLTIIQPFFVELTLPYSVIRGETLLVKAVPHNYLDKSVKMEVVMEDSNAFIAEMREGEQGACVGPNGRASYTWEVQANVIGEISFTVSAKTTHIGDSCDGPNDPSQRQYKDTVVQTIISEAEGIHLEHTLSNLVYVENNNIQLPISITLPQTVVPDSATAYVTAVGDILGLPLQNLEDLLQKPYGSGEMNLARVAPIPYVLEYLNVTGQLTDKILEKAKSLMSEGYYRQLSFASGDGYKLFPNSIEDYNSMLTAYTFKVFESIKPHVFIDKDRQQQTLILLENSQNLENGCLTAKGKLLSIQDADSNLHFTAYMAIALLESEYSLGTTILNGALECLKNASRTEQNINDQVLMLYAFTLAKLEEYRKPLLDNLMKKVKTEDGMMHWEREDMPKRRPVYFFEPLFYSAEVEIAGYILLSIATAPDVTQESLTTMAQICMWLARQQNSHGGCRSTQDTVVALQALSAAAKHLYTPNSQQTVMVRRGNGEVTTFDLNKDSRLVVQRESLPDTSGDYNIDVSGSGWCMIQTTVKYNILVPKENTAFALSMSTSSESCVNGVAYSFTMNVTVSYKGSRKESGVTVINMKPLSGFSVEHSSMGEMVSKKIISKFEENPKGEIILYLENVTKETINLSFRFLIDRRVMNVKDGSAVVYSANEPDENGYASYSHPCAGIKGAYS